MRRKPFGSQPVLNPIEPGPQRTRSDPTESEVAIDLAHSPAYLMSLACGMAHAVMDRRMSVHDLTGLQWKPLYALWTGQAGNAAEIAALLRVDAGAVTRMLDRLEAKELISRSRDESDRRVLRLTLTRAGRAAAARIPAELCQLDQELAAGLSDRQRAELVRLLQRVVATLQGPADGVSGNSNSYKDEGKA